MSLIGQEVKFIIPEGDNMHSKQDLVFGIVIDRFRYCDSNKIISDYFFIEDSSGYLWKVKAIYIDKIFKKEVRI